MTKPVHTDLAASWIDDLPMGVRPFARLARWDRPIGIWLLLWPCLWPLTLAAPKPVPIALYVLFAIGAIAMRGAGCTLNDMLDRDIDAKVARTRGRPLPAGEVTLVGAGLFLALQALVGLVVLWAMDGFTRWLGLASLALVLPYPLMKRVTYWPQAWLGLTFNWGALMGWSALYHELAAPAFWLYGAGVFWTLSYDTIYAYQDREDDIVAGVRSTALKFGARPKPFVIGFTIAMLALLLGAGLAAGRGWGWHLAIALMGGMALARIHVWRPEDPTDCLSAFRQARFLGLMVWLAGLSGYWLP